MNTFPWRPMRVLALMPAPRFAALFIALFIGLFSVAPVSAQEPPLPTNAEVRGVVSVIHADDFAAQIYETEVFLLLSDGKSMVVNKTEGVGSTTDWQALEGMPVVAQVPMTEIAAASMDPAFPVALAGVRLDETTQIAEMGSAEVDEAGAVHLRFVNMLCKFTDGVEPTRTPADIASWFNPARVNSIPHYFKTVSYGNLTIEFTTVTRWETMPVPFASLGNNFSSMLAAMAAQCDPFFRDVVDLSKFDGVLYFTNVNNRFSFAGYANHILPDNTTRFMRTAFLSWFGGRVYSHGTITHEIGHTLGEPHTFDDDGREYEYSNKWDVMSGNPCGTSTDSYEAWEYCPSHDFIAPHKLNQGWIAANRILTATAGISAVVKLDWLALGGTTTNTTVIVVPIADGIFYTVEARKNIASTYDRALGRSALLVHEVATKRWPRVYRVAGIHNWPGKAEPNTFGDTVPAHVVGSIWYAHDIGMSIEVLGEDATGLTVRVRRNSIALRGAPSREMAVRADDSQRGNVAVTAVIANQTDADYENAEFVLHLGQWSYDLYSPSPDVEFANVEGATCRQSPYAVVCSLPAIAAGKTHTVTFDVEPFNTGLILYRSHLFTSTEVTSKVPTDITLVRMSQWSSTDVAITPATQPLDDDMALEFSVTNRGANVKDLVLDIYLPTGPTFYSTQWEYGQMRGFWEPKWDFEDWPHVRISSPRFDAGGYMELNFLFAYINPPDSGIYPVVFTSGQSPSTPDPDGSDNVAFALICAEACTAIPPLNREINLPAIRR